VEVNKGAFSFFSGLSNLSDALYLLLHNLRDTTGAPGPGGPRPGCAPKHRCWTRRRVRKKWWLAPVLIVLVLVGAPAVFAETSALAPFIYTIF
jgi:hypothetical protein